DGNRSQNRRLESLIGGTCKSYLTRGHLGRPSHLTMARRPRSRLTSRRLARRRTPMLSVQRHGLGVRGQLAVAAVLVALGHGVPIDDVPPGGHVGWPLVVILEVVGVLPDVDAKHWVTPFTVWTILICRALDTQAAIGIQRQPGPTTAKSTSGGGAKLRLEVVE